MPNHPIVSGWVFCPKCRWILIEECQKWLQCEHYKGIGGKFGQGVFVLCGYSAEGTVESVKYEGVKDA